MQALLLLALASAPPPVKLASAGFAAVGLDAELAGFYGDHFAQKLSEEPGLSVVTPRDVSALLGLERQGSSWGARWSRRAAWRSWPALSASTGSSPATSRRWGRASC